MARPTKTEQERKRVANLLAEGKGPNGEPIEDGQIISETKNPVKEEDKTGGYSITELEQEIESSTLGKGTANTNTTEEKTGFDINTGDARIPDAEDPNYVKPSGHDRFRESIIENESDANKAATGKSASTENPLSNTPPPPPQPKDFAEPIINGSTTPNPEDEKKKDEPLNPDLDKLSPADKLKNVELFANAIITTYAELYQAAFSGYCSINMNKMEILDREGNIRLSMVLERNGGTGEMTVREVFREYNDEAHKIFEVSPEMQEELREPLIAVLMEKGIAPTPIITLGIILGKHIFQGVMSTVQLKGKMNEQLEWFKQRAKEEDEKELAAHKNKQHNGPPVVHTAEAPKTEPTTIQKETVIVSMEEVLKTESKPVEIKSEAKENNNNSGITLEEVVN